MCSYQLDEPGLEYFNILDEPIEDYNYFDLNDVFEPTWREKPMKEWSPSEVLEFIRNEASSQLSLFVDLDRFECISGYIFQNLSKEYCQTLTQSSTFGEVIFDAKEQYLANEIILNSNLPVQTSDQENTQNKINCDDKRLTPKRHGRSKLANRRRKNEKKSERLWEFLLHLLRDKRTCPEIIRWENFEEGTFKFVKSDRVAQLWGSRNQNETMTYEKLTRAIRYHYKSQILLPVPGKKLVYKFGPQAKGWNSVSYF